MSQRVGWTYPIRAGARWTPLWPGVNSFRRRKKWRTKRASGSRRGHCPPSPSASSRAKTSVLDATDPRIKATVEIAQAQVNVSTTVQNCLPFLHCQSTKLSSPAHCTSDTAFLHQFTGSTHLLSYFSCFLLNTPWPVDFPVLVLIR